VYLSFSGWDNMVVVSGGTKKVVLRCRTRNGNF
jgi:hypothetical protein